MLRRQKKHNRIPPLLLLGWRMNLIRYHFAFSWESHWLAAPRCHMETMRQEMSPSLSFRRRLPRVPRIRRSTPGDGEDLAPPLQGSAEAASLPMIIPSVDNLVRAGKHGLTTATATRFVVGLIP
jgi:hypothetical protein